MFQIAVSLYYVSMSSVLLPIIFLLKGKQNFKNSSVKVLGILLFTSMFSDLGGYVLIKMGKSNISLSNIYFIVQFLVLSYLYYLLLKNKKIIYAALIIFTIFFIFSTLFIHSIYEDQSWSNFVGSILILIYSVNYYGQVLKAKVDLLRFSSFWLNSAIFLYFAFDLFLFATTNYIMKNMDVAANMTAWSFHSCSSILKNIVFTIAISYVGAKQVEPYDDREI